MQVKTAADPKTNKSNKRPSMCFLPFWTCMSNKDKNMLQRSNFQQSSARTISIAQENNSSNMRPNAMWGQLQRQWKSQLSNDASTAQIKIGKQVKRKTKHMHNHLEHQTTRAGTLAQIAANTQNIFRHQSAAIRTQSEIQSLTSCKNWVLRKHKKHQQKKHEIHARKCQEKEKTMLKQYTDTFIFWEALRFTLQRLSAAPRNLRKNCKAKTAANSMDMRDSSS